MRWFPLWGLIFSMPALAEAPSKPPQTRVLFGHQSVGRNVLDGVRGLAPDLAVAKGRDVSALKGGGLLEFDVGRNEHPFEKLADFERTAGELGGSVDVALFKFCYVDFTADTDVDKLLTEYEAAAGRIKARHPHLTLVRVTAPLTTVQTGVKGWLKRTLGSGAWGERENEKRQAFNERLRQLSKVGPLFDLAKVEATRPDGTAESFERGGRQVPALVPAYTDDGGHLNAEGARRAAAELLRVLQATATATAAP